MRIGTNQTTPLRTAAAQRSTRGLPERNMPEKPGSERAPRQTRGLPPRAMTLDSAARRLGFDPEQGCSLKTFHPDQQRQVLDLMSQLDTAAREALKNLLAQGRLGNELLFNLSRLATQPLGAGLSRGKLLSATLREIDDPARISQGDRQTCAAATAQILLAKENPAEYARLLAELSSPEGKATLSNGGTLERDRNRNTQSGRSITGDLLQSPFMQYASGGYDSLKDIRKDGTGQGLYADEQDKLSAALIGTGSKSVFGSSDRLLEQIARAAASGRTVSADIVAADPATGEKTGHAVAIEGIENGKVTYLDPHEGRKTVALSEFRAKLESASLPKEFVTPALEKASTPSGRGRLAAGWLPNPLAMVKAVATAVVAPARAFIDAAKTLLQTSADAAFDSYRRALGLIGSMGQAARAVAQAVEKWVQGNKGYLLIGLQVVTMFIPGLQVVSLGLALYNGLDGASSLIDGARTGNWKRALQGAVSFAGSFALGSNALANGALGGMAAAGAKGLVPIANSAANVSKFFEGVEAAAEARDPGSLLSVSKELAVNSGVFGEHTAALSRKLSDYAASSQAIYQAWKKGGASGLTAALDLASASSGDKKLAENFKNLSNQAKNIDRLADAVKRGNCGDAAKLMGVTDTGVIALLKNVGGDAGNAIAKLAKASEDKDDANASGLFGIRDPGLRKFLEGAAEFRDAFNVEDSGKPSRSLDRKLAVGEGKLREMLAQTFDLGGPSKAGDQLLRLLERANHLFDPCLRLLQELEKGIPAGIENLLRLLEGIRALGVPETVFVRLFEQRLHLLHSANPAEAAAIANGLIEQLKSLPREALEKINRLSSQDGRIPQLVSPSERRDALALRSEPEKAKGALQKGKGRLEQPPRNH